MNQFNLKKFTIQNLNFTLDHMISILITNGRIDDVYDSEDDEQRYNDIKREVQERNEAINEISNILSNSMS